jgi:O-antigen/teichoic acid export membrane protein
MFLNLSSRYLLTALDRQRHYLRAILAGLIVNVVGCVVLIPRLGFLGACGAYLAAELAVRIVGFRALGGRLHVTELAKVAGKPVLAALGMGLLIFACRRAGVITMVALGAVAYVGLLIVLRAFSKEEMQMFRAVGGSIRFPRTSLLRRAEDQA